MTTEHTPGPWRVADEGIVMFTPTGNWRDAMPVKVASGFIEDAWCGGNGTRETLANAYLIAAAPELLEALEMLLAEARERGGGVSNGERLGCIAIAKAKGAA